MVARGAPGCQRVERAVGIVDKAKTERWGSKMLVMPLRALPEVVLVL